mmetsp:Transcript_76899/g.135475  ORF Transcript_76899/g.135475 Transcript_76899/m.135475 type:complete len:243 (+) Transcript_76899:44-772(+)
MKLLYKMLTPMDSFCCGCSLDSGIRCILTYYTVQAIFYILVVFFSVVMDMKVWFSEMPASTQAIRCGLALASSPFIAAGWSGVTYKIEAHLRIFQTWLLASVSLDTVLMFVALLGTGCSALSGFNGAGGAYACGALQAFNWTYTGLWTATSLYCLYIVWSRCEELKVIDTESSFKGMLDRSFASEKANLKKGLQYTGFFGLGDAAPPARPVVYGSLASPVFHGSNGIFGRRQHEMQFPPPGP